jgi:hypothetical protein
MIVQATVYLPIGGTLEFRRGTPEVKKIFIGSAHTLRPGALVVVNSLDVKTVFVDLPYSYKEKEDADAT